jgi:hypothetical protein
LRKSNEKIVTAYKLAIVMLGMQKKSSPVVPGAIENPMTQEHILVNSNPSTMEIETIDSGTRA